MKNPENFDTRGPRAAWRSIGVALVVGVTWMTMSIPAAKAQSMAESEAPFVAWHQGFEHNTVGWYDNTTAGPLGWCGGLTRVSPDNPGAAAPGPSAGRAYATATFGFCNQFWNSLGVPFGAPYGPGPDLAIAMNAWPAAGYVTDLDVYLDPAWSASYAGNFEFAGIPASTLIQYAATIFPTDYAPGDIHTGPHYFVDVEAVPGEQALSVGGYTVSEAGWFTFRFQFLNDGGAVRVDFELLDRTGGRLAKVDDIAATNLLGPFRTPFTDAIETGGYTTGWVWFFDIAFGLELPIDQHLQRTGR